MYQEIFLNFGFCKTNNFNEIPELFFKAITKIIKKQGTIIVPTHTFYLANTNKIFNLKKKPKVSLALFQIIFLRRRNQLDKFTLSLLQQQLEKNAKYFCSKNTDNVYGIDSPFDRMIKKTKFLSLGLPINQNCSQVHHAEFMMRVPYRYNKKFRQKIKVKNHVYKKDFYMFVLKEKFFKY